MIDGHHSTMFFPNVFLKVSITLTGGGKQAFLVSASEMYLLLRWKWQPQNAD